MCQAIVQYNREQKNRMLLEIPQHVNFQEHIMLLTEKRITLDHAEALNKYLKITRDVADCRVFKLVIDSV